MKHYLTLIKKRDKIFIHILHTLPREGAQKEIAIHSCLSGKDSFSTYKGHYLSYKCYCDVEYQEEYQVKITQIGPTQNNSSF